MGSVLTVRDNEYDIKIYTKVFHSLCFTNVLSQAKLSGRIFNKGHGVRLVERKMGMKLQDGKTWFFGNTQVISRQRSGLR